MTVLVTGARGGVARTAIRMLREKGVGVRAASSDPSKAEPIEGVAVIGLDLTDPASVEAALDGVDAVFTYAAKDIGGLVDGMRKTGVSRVVLLSSIAAEYAGSTIGAFHLAAEEPLRSSGIPTTVLRPGMFATNARWWADSIRTEGVVRIPYPDAQVCPIHEADMADVAVAALTGPGHEDRVYPMGGPESLSQRRMAELIGEAIGREITVEEMPHEVAAKFMPEDVLRIFAANGGVPVPTGPLTQDITGIPSRTFAQWAADHADDFR